MCHRMCWHKRVCYARVFFDYGTKGKHTVNVLHWTRDEAVLPGFALPGAPPMRLLHAKAWMHTLFSRTNTYTINVTSREYNLILLPSGSSYHTTSAAPTITNVGWGFWCSIVIPQWTWYLSLMQLKSYTRTHKPFSHECSTWKYAKRICCNSKIHYCWQILNFILPCCEMGCY